MSNSSNKNRSTPFVSQLIVTSSVAQANDNNNAAIKAKLVADVANVAQRNPARATNVVPLRAITALDDHELDNFEANYRKAARISGGAYSLHEVMNEKAKRAAAGLNSEQLVGLILELSCRSQDGFTTYANLWAALFPAKPWCGRQTVRAIMKIMDLAIKHCVDNSLPIVTTLIVRTDTRKHSDDAVTNIYNAARNYGAEVGPSQQEFVDTQILEAFYLAQAAKTHRLQS